MPGKNVLLVDNDPDFLETRAEYLEGAGYRVLKAYSPEEARRKLDEGNVHLAILDLRLVDDDDEKDISGLTLAKDPDYRVVPKVILTAFPSYEAVRDALGRGLDGLPPAVHFLDKKEGPEVMIHTIQEASEAHVRINQDLKVRWDAQKRLSFLYLGSLLQPGMPYDVMAKRAGELKDLFCRLFYDYEQIRVPTLFWHRDDRFCLPVLARSPRGVVDARVVICGERQTLEHETRLLEELAPQTGTGARLDCTAETVHFRALSYVLHDADVGTIRPVGALFADGKERPLRAAFSHLLTSILPSWHQRGETVDDRDLLSLYRQEVGLGDAVSRGEVERRFDALISTVRSLGRVEIERDKGTIAFCFPQDSPRTCPDPVAAAFGSLQSHSSANLCRVSPGRLTADNILVDTSEHTWLTDFERAGQRPQLWDFIELEAMLRFDLAHAPDLLAWLQFEECLARPTSLRDKLPSQEVISSLKTNVVLIEQIRHQAGNEVGAELLPYEAGLLIWTIGSIAEYDPEGLYTHAERMRFAHLLLASGFLADRITRPASALPHPTKAGPLRLDADGVQLWRGEQRIASLGPQERRLFKCLYDHAGQVVKRETLVREVYGEKFDPGDKYQEGRLNALVRRLRINIETDPANPRYLFTSKGQGYCLLPDEP